MREIKIGEKEIRVRATTLALLYYKQEFKADLIGDFLRITTGVAGTISRLSNIPLDKLSEVGLKIAEPNALTDIDVSRLSLEDLSSLNIDMVGILQLVWAMAKADGHGSSFPGFEAWVFSLGEFDLFDTSFLAPVIEEAADGFFRRGNKQGQQS